MMKVMYKAFKEVFSLAGRGWAPKQLAWADLRFLLAELRAQKSEPVSLALSPLGERFNKSDWASASGRLGKLWSGGETSLGPFLGLEEDQMQKRVFHSLYFSILWRRITFESLPWLNDFNLIWSIAHHIFLRLCLTVGDELSRSVTQWQLLPCNLRDLWIANEVITPSGDNFPRKQITSIMRPV